MAREIDPADLGANPPEQRLSSLFRRIAASGTTERVTIAEMVATLEGRTLAVLLVLFALPNSLPMGIPGTSAVTGLPMVVLAAQMVLGLRPWLPGFVLRRSVPRAGLQTVIDRATPWLKRIEALLRPRFGAALIAASERLIGLVILVLALCVMMPIPFGNALPAIAIVFLAMGLMERDGVWIIAGLAMAVVAAAVIAMIGWAFLMAMMGLAGG